MLRGLGEEQGAPHPLLARADAAAAARDWEAALALYAQARGVYEGSGSLTDASNEARARVGEAMALRRVGHHGDEVAAWDAMIARFSPRQEELESYRRAPGPPVAAYAAEAGVMRAEAIRDARDMALAIAAYEEVVRRHAESPELGVCRWVAAAMFGRALVFGGLGRHGDELAALEQLIARFDASAGPPDNELSRWVAAAWVNRGDVLQAMGRTEEGLAAFRAVQRRFAASRDQEVSSVVMTAMHNVAAAQAASGRRTEAVAVLDELIARYAGGKGGPCPAPIQAAYLTRAWCRGTSRQVEAAIDDYETLIARCIESNDPDTMDRVAAALSEEGRAFLALNRRHEARAAFQRIIQRFADVDEPRVAARVAEARGQVPSDAGDREEDSSARFRRREQENSRSFAFWFIGVLVVVIVFNVIIQVAIRW